MATATKRHTYRLELDAGEAEAIFWHDGRYLASEIMASNMSESDAGDGSWILELDEPEAWELKQAWEDEDFCLACGSRELNTKLDDFIEGIV